MDHAILTANIEQALQCALEYIYDEHAAEMADVMIEVCAVLATQYGIPSIGYRAKWLDCMRYLHGLLTKSIDDMDAWLVLIAKMCILARFWNTPGQALTLTDMQKMLPFSKTSRLSDSGKKMFAEIVLSDEADIYCANFLTLCVSKKYADLRLMMEWVSRKKTSLPLCRTVKDYASGAASVEPWWFVWSFQCLFFGETTGYLKERIELFTWNINKQNVKSRMGLVFAGCWPMGRVASLTEQDTWDGQELGLMDVVQKAAFDMYDVFVKEHERTKKGGETEKKSGRCGGGGEANDRGRESMSKYLDGEHDLFLNIIPTLDSSASSTELNDCFAIEVPSKTIQYSKSAYQPSKTKEVREKKQSHGGKANRTTAYNSTDEDMYAYESQTPSSRGRRCGSPFHSYQIK